MVELKKLQIESDSSDLTAKIIHDIYDEAFPVEERRPWADLALLSSTDSRFGLYGIYCDDACVGMMSVWRLGEFAYIEHFAIDRDKRGAGIGAQAIEIAKSLTADAKHLILEVEAPDTGQARRRIDFYKRHGFAYNGSYMYNQPPYTHDLPWVPMKIMNFSNVMQDIDLQLIEKILHKEVYGFEKV